MGGGDFGNEEIRHEEKVAVAKNKPNKKKKKTKKKKREREKKRVEILYLAAQCIFFSYHTVELYAPKYEAWSTFTDGVPRYLASHDDTGCIT